MVKLERQKLKKLLGWAYNKKTRSISVTFLCKDFLGVVRLIGKIARLAEKADHHPNLHLTRYRRLKVVLSTHSEGKVTAKDLALAGKINKLR